MNLKLQQVRLIRKIISKQFLDEYNNLTTIDQGSYQVIEVVGEDKTGFLF